jgi:hypothetical protein
MWVKREPFQRPSPARSGLDTRSLPAFGTFTLHAAGRQYTLDLLQRKVYQERSAVRPHLSRMVAL